MPTSAGIRAVFGHFQNLNLLALLHDLRLGRTARQAWYTSGLLCPVAHGLPHGIHVRELSARAQMADLDTSCDFAARRLGADARAVLRFVRSWDEQTLAPASLIRQLEDLWEERLADAEAVQALLEGVSSASESRVVSQKH